MYVTAHGGVAEDHEGAGKLRRLCQDLALFPAHTQTLDRVREVGFNVSDIISNYNDNPSLNFQISCMVSGSNSVIQNA